MERESPVWQPFDPGEPGSGISLSRPADESRARMLVILASTEVARDGWAPRAAVSLVRQLASRNGRTLLADLALREPSLHETLGTSNDEGVSDVFLWGASFQRVAHSVEPGLLFAPAGTVVADPVAVAESTRWDTVIDGFRKARATLALYVPHDSPALDAVLERASDVVVLATRGESAELDLAGWGERIRAVLGPASAAAGPAKVEGAAEPLRDAGTSGEEPDPAWEREVVGAVSGAGPSRSRTAVWVVLALLVVVVVVVAAWRGWVDIPYLSPMLAGVTELVEPEEEVVRSASEPGPESPAVEEAEPVTGGGSEGAADAAAPGGPPRGEPASGEPAGPLQRFSLALASYPDAGSAWERVQTLSARRPDVTFLIAPVEVDGRVFHRLLAGLAEDPPGVMGLRASLEETFGSAEAQRWIVRDARWAYLLGESASLTEARARARELASGGVLPYVLELTGGGEAAYRIYAGAYADRSEASALGAMLSERGLDAPLVPRAGRIPG